MLPEIKELNLYIKHPFDKNCDKINVDYKGEKMDGLPNGLGYVQNVLGLRIFWNFTNGVLQGKVLILEPVD